MGIKKFVEFNNLLKIVISVFLAYFCTVIYLVIVNDNFLNRLSFTTMEILFILLVFVFKQTVKISDAIYLISVLLWVGWFALCLRGKAAFISYKNMIYSIGLVFILCIIVIGSYIPKVFYCYFIVISALITAIISLSYLSINESVVRLIATGSVENRGLGIGGYEFAYCLSFMFPCYFLHIKKGKRIEKLVLIGFVIVAGYYCFKCGLATTLMISALSLVLYWALNIKEKKKKYFIVIIATFVFMVYVLGGFSFFVNSISNIKVDNRFISEKLSDIVIFINGGVEEHGTISGRTNKYMLSWSGFLESPIVGWFFNTEPSNNLGAHSSILDYLAITGVFGVSLFALVMCISLKKILQTLKTNDCKNCYKSIFIIFILVSILKGTNYASIFMTIFLLSPLYLSALETSRSESFLLSK